MAGKIFYRERRKVAEGEKKPRFTLVAVTGLDLTLYPKHMRKQELEQIAEAVGAVDSAERRRKRRGSGS